MVFVDERGVSGLTVAALARRAGLSPAAALALAIEIERTGDLCRFDESLFAARLVASIEDRLVAAVAEHHRLHPIAEGLPREEARERLLSSAAPGLFDRVVQRLTAGNRLTGRDRLALPGRGVSLTREETHAQAELERVYREAGLAPPDLAGAATAAGVAAPVADRMVKLLVRQKTLVKIDSMLFHAEPLARLKQELAALKAGEPSTKVDVAGFKDRYGISRKYAIPLLEWLDRERVTRRVGDARVLL
jgi:selenocysteine-specific elongation factor